MPGYESIEGPEQSPLERGLALLQAAVATACLQDIDVAYGYLDRLMIEVTDRDSMRRVAIATTAFMFDNNIYQGAEWVTRGLAEGQSIEDKSPPWRVSSRRILASWPDDPDNFDALLEVALERPRFLRDLFEFAVDHAEYMSVRHGSPWKVLYAYTRSIHQTQRRPSSGG